MNRPVYTARRDAAHICAVDILRRATGARGKARRAALYQACLSLLEDGLTATRRSQMQQESFVTHYLQLLRETVSANLALVTHEMRLRQEASEFSRLLGPDTLAQFQTATDVFTASEKKILKSMNDLLAVGETIIARDRDKRRSTFSADESRRYELALREYQEFYRRSKGK